LISNYDETSPIERKMESVSSMSSPPPSSFGNAISKSNRKFDALRPQLTLKIPDR